MALPSSARSTVTRVCHSSGQNLAVADEFAFQQARNHARLADVHAHMALGEAQGDVFFRIRQDFRNVAQNASANHRADRLAADDILLARASRYPSSATTRISVWLISIRQPGQNRAALVLRNGEQRPADHILERVLGQFKACALHLRQFRIFHRIETVDRRANARAANRRLASARRP